MYCLVRLSALCCCLAPEWSFQNLIKHQGKFSFWMVGKRIHLDFWSLIHHVVRFQYINARSGLLIVSSNSMWYKSIQNKIDTAQTLTKVQIGYTHYCLIFFPHLNRYPAIKHPSNCCTIPSHHINSYVESVLRNIWVPPLTSRELSIVFTGSGFLIKNAFFLLNEIELGKINTKFVFLVAFYVD